MEPLGPPYPEEDDDPVPAGDLDLLGDLGLHADRHGRAARRRGALPDEVLSDVADRLGFGALFDEAVGLTSA